VSRRSRARGCRARRSASRPEWSRRPSGLARGVFSRLLGLPGGVAFGLGLAFLALTHELGLGLDLVLDRFKGRRGDRGDDGLFEVVEGDEAEGDSAGEAESASGDDS